MFTVSCQGGIIYQQILLQMLLENHVTFNVTGPLISVENRWLNRPGFINIYIFPSLPMPNASKWEERKRGGWIDLNSAVTERVRKHRSTIVRIPRCHLPKPGLTPLTEALSGYAQTKYGLHIFTDKNSTKILKYLKDYCIDIHPKPTMTACITLDTREMVGRKSSFGAWPWHSRPDDSTPGARGEDAVTQMHVLLGDSKLDQCFGGSGVCKTQDKVVDG